MKINFKLMALCLVGYSFAPGDNLNQYSIQPRNLWETNSDTSFCALSSRNGSNDSDSDTSLCCDINDVIVSMIDDPLSGAYLIFKKENGVSALDDSGFEESFEEFRNQLFQKHVAPFVIQPEPLQPEDESLQTEIGAEITDDDLKSIKDRDSLLRLLGMPRYKESFDVVQYVGPSITKECFSLQNGEQKSFYEILHSSQYRNYYTNSNFLYELMSCFPRKVVNCFDRVLDVLLFFTEYTGDCPTLRRKITQYIYENFHKENISELIKKVMYIRYVENDSITLRNIAKDLLSKDLFDELCQFYDIFTIGSRHRQKCYADHQEALAQEALAQEALAQKALAQEALAQDLVQDLAQGLVDEKKVLLYFQWKQDQCSCSIKAAQEIMQFGNVYCGKFSIKNEYLKWIGELCFIQLQFEISAYRFMFNFFHRVNRQLNYGVLTKDQLKELKEKFSTPNVWTNPVIFHEVITAMPWLIECVQNSFKNSFNNQMFLHALLKKFNCFYCKHHYGAAVARLDNALKF